MGVYWYEQGQKWRAHISFKGKRYYLGSFSTIEEAEAARKKAEKKYFQPMIEKYKDEMLKINKTDTK